MDYLLPFISLHDHQGRPLVLAAANLLAGISQGAHLVSEGNKHLEEVAKTFSFMAEQWELDFS